MNDRTLLQGLVEIPSVTGDEDAACAWLAKQARADGFEVEVDGAGNVHIIQARDGRLVLAVGHIDTVPGDIRVRVEDGELWGRGAVDAKGCLAAFYCALRRVPGINMRIVACVDEEGTSRGARALPTDWKPTVMLIGEPSGAAGITVGYKGILRGTISVMRPAVHGAHPDAGALDAFVEVWSEIGRSLEFDARFDAVQGRLDGLRHEHDGMEETVDARFQIRLPPGTEPDTVKRRIQTTLAGQGANLVIREAVPAVMGDARSELVARFRAAIRSQGLEPSLKKKTGTSDWNVLAPHYPVPTVAYGPGDSKLDHAPDERLSLQEFDQAVAVLVDVLRGLVPND